MRKFNIKEIQLSLLIIGLTLLSNCGPDTTEETSDLDGLSLKNRTPVVVILSGWNTCTTRSNGLFDPVGSNVWDKSEDIIAEARARYQKEPKWLTLCYTFWKQTSTGKGRYLSHNNPVAYKRVSPDETVELIREMLKEIENPDLFLTGFSMGGWLALKVANELGGTVNIPMLATLDPISQMDCNMLNFTLYWLFGGYEGCRRYPPAYQPDDLQKRIKKNTGTWLHYYQQDYALLQSGPAKFADRQRLVKTKYNDNSAHNVVVRSEGAWSDIKDVINNRSVSHETILFNDQDDLFIEETPEIPEDIPEED